MSMRKYESSESIVLGYGAERICERCEKQAGIVDSQHDMKAEYTHVAKEMK